jgi:hypothetical protein
MKIYAFLLVLLSAFCAAFARYDISNPERRSRTALLRSTTGNRIVAVTRDLKSLDTKADTRDVDTDDDDTDDDDTVSLPDTESDFNSDSESIDGSSDDDCPTGQYTLKYIRKQRFSSGRKYKRVKANNLRSCGRACAKQPGGKCNTFNWNKNKKQCQMFSTKNTGRKKVKDNAGVAAYLKCIE